MNLTERAYRKKKKSSPEYVPSKKKRRLDDEDSFYDNDNIADDGDDEIRKIRRKTEYLSPTSDGEREPKKKSMYLKVFNILCIFDIFELLHVMYY